MRHIAIGGAPGKASLFGADIPTSFLYYADMPASPVIRRYNMLPAVNENPGLIAALSNVLKSTAAPNITIWDLCDCGLS